MATTLFLLDCAASASAFYMAYKVYKQLYEYGSALFVSMYFALGGVGLAYIAYNTFPFTR